MARSMLDLIKGTTPKFELCQATTVRKHIEMAMAAHLSHIQGNRVNFPLTEASNPFDSWPQERN